MGSPAASVIIRAFNEEELLPSLFDALDAQDHGDFETIVIDSGSYDRTCEIAEARATRLVRIPHRDFTFGHSLNVGIRESRGRFAAIVSAHAIPMKPDWLTRLTAPLAEEKTAMVSGGQRGCATSKYGELRDFERLFGEERRVLSLPDFFVNNANSAVRRDLWEKHPFDETLPGLEDIAWAKHWLEQGCRVVYEPEAKVTHIHRETWPQVRRRYYREGQAAKWIGVRRRRELAAFAAAEARAFFEDLASAACDGSLSRKVGEIARFRWEKLLGTVQGVRDGAAMANPMARDKFLFDRSYKAVVVQGPGSAKVEERKPPELTPSEVLVRVAYQGVCATDLEVLDGSLGYYKDGLAAYPIVPGHEFSGTVAGAGPRVEGLKTGDRVVVECIQGCGECARCREGNPIACAARREVGVIGRDGGYSEYMVTPSRFVHVIPQETSLLDACLTEPLAVVLKGLRRLSPKPGASAGIVGAGPIGHLAARVLLERGHSVTVFDRRADRLALLEGSGARLESSLENVGELDALVEATGNPEALDAVLHGSRPGAEILLLGLPYDRREFGFEAIVGYDRSVVGSVGSAGEDFAEALRLLPKLDLTAFRGGLMPFAEYREAWRLARGDGPLKVVLKVDPGVG